MAKKTAADIAVEGKRVLVRVDFNVPLDPVSVKILDDTRIRASLPTIQHLIQHRARTVLCSHLGRPKGKSKELSLRPVAERLSQLLNGPVAFATDCVGPEAETAIGRLSSGQVLLLENLRFHAEEEANDPSFARGLAQLADVFVNDAFGAAHRAHASTVGVTRYLPSVAGFLLEKEVRILTRLLTSPDHPFAVLVGGAKVSDKLPLLKQVLARVDFVLVGGGMVSTFLKAQGCEVGKSQVEDPGQAEDLLELAKRRKVDVLLPVDVVAARSPDADAGEFVRAAAIPADTYIVDIGPETVALFAATLKRCRTVFWNGPMGIYERPAFARGTEGVAHALAELKATVVVGGGSTADVVSEMGLASRFAHVSTGGGASMELLEGKVLPGVEALPEKT